MFAPRTIKELRIDPAALALAKPAGRVERESSMVRRIRGAPSRPVPRPPRLFLHAPPPAEPFEYRLESFPLKAPDTLISMAGLFNIQFHSGLRRNETSGLGGYLTSGFVH